MGDDSQQPNTPHWVLFSFPPSLQTLQPPSTGQPQPCHQTLAPANGFVKFHFLPVSLSLTFERSDPLWSALCVYRMYVLENLPTTSQKTAPPSVSRGLAFPNRPDPLLLRFSGLISSLYNSFPERSTEIKGACSQNTRHLE